MKDSKKNIGNSIEELILVGNNAHVTTETKQYIFILQETTMLPTIDSEVSKKVTPIEIDRRYKLIGHE